MLRFCGGSAKKVGNRIKALEKIYGIKMGNPTGNNQYSRKEELANSCLIPRTQEDLAEKLGISVSTLKNYKALLDMIPELEDLVDTGIVSTTTAVAIVREDQRGSGGGKISVEVSGNLRI